MAYDISNDPDLNEYDTDDLKDLTKAGMGTAGREVVMNLEFLVFLLIALFILGVIAALILRAKGFFKTK